MKKIDRWHSQILVSKRGFKCGYCEKERKGAYRWCDGSRSCEACNRSYDPPNIIQEVYSIDCPLCKGKGKLKNEY